MAEEKKKSKGIVETIFGGMTGNAEKEIRSRKSKVDAAIAEAEGDTKAAEGKERPAYSKKWVE